MTRPNILTFVACYLPGYKSGGPIQSIANLVAHLGTEFNFQIVTRDRDTGDDQSYPGVDLDRWQAVGNAQVRYMPFSAQTFVGLARVMRQTPHDLIYLNSFFNWRSTILPLLARRVGLVPKVPVLLAPRGEFSKGALALKSGKKRTFIAASKLFGLHRGVIWQASTEYEAQDIRAVFGQEQQVFVASNLPRSVDEQLAHQAREAGDPLRIIFLSRISPKKNLSFIFDVLAKVKVPVHFYIVGPKSDQEYWNECEAKIGQLPSNITVTYDGIAPADQVPAILAKSDLFFLPTLGENFGHVIIEALGAGTPVMISDQTPWQDMEAQGCGWVFPLGSDEIFSDTINSLFEEGVDLHEDRRRNALKFAKNFQENGGAIDRNREMFFKAMSNS